MIIQTQPPYLIRNKQVSFECAHPYSRTLYIVAYALRPALNRSVPHATAAALIRAIAARKCSMVLCLKNEYFNSTENTYESIDIVYFRYEEQSAKYYSLVADSYKQKTIRFAYGRLLLTFNV